MKLRASAMTLTSELPAKRNKKSIAKEKKQYDNDDEFVLDEKEKEYIDTTSDRKKDVKKRITRRNTRQRHTPNDKCKERGDTRLYKCPVVHSTSIRDR